MVHLARVLRLALAAALVGLALASPARASAQLQFLIEAGLSYPSGDFSKLAQPGYHGRLGLQMKVPHVPLSFRAEGEADRLVSAASIGHLSVVSGSGSAVLSLPGPGISPYVLAGIGQYRTSFEEVGISSSIGTGYHVGVGLSFGALDFGGFVELRLVNVDGDRYITRYFPISLGLRVW